MADTAGPEHQLSAQWNRVRGRLRQEVGEAAFHSWLTPLVLAGVRDGAVQMGLPTRFQRDWVARHYADRLRSLWCGENPAVRTVELLVVPSRAPKPMPVIEADAGALVTLGDDAPLPARAVGGDRSRWSQSSAPPPLPSLRTGGVSHTGATPGPGVTAAPASGDTQDALVSGELDARFTFDDFVVGKPNELAFAAARRVAEQPTAEYNPLFLYGGVGLGKTHLMHAIAWEIRRREPGRRVVYMSAEKFMYQFVRALRFKDTLEFKNQFRSVDVLMIDDVQFISGKDSTQEEFFHTFNALVDQRKQLVISADKSPSDLEGLEERLRSRLGWGLVADIHPTTYELRLGILQSKLEQQGADIPQKVLELLAHKVQSNVRELEGALTRLTAHAKLVNRSITVDVAQDVLQDVLRANDRRVTIEDIQRRVCEHFGIRHADMSSARRARAVARPRQVAMYLAKQLTTRSLPEIGRKFGGRDHTTVMHAVRKIEELVASDAALAEDVALLRGMLGG
ncbi:MAG: chromosomal replication initiator protein DnaA [Alphaproteobacteria bacterium]|nr:chromosomal replication initiator protein DnaA [Alphaproteobacteria bacterium]